MGESLRVPSLYQNAVLDHFRNSRGARRHNRLARGHRFQEDNSKAFLNTRQAEDVRTIVFLGQGRKRQISKPPHNSFETQILLPLLKPPVLRPVADDSHFASWN